MVKTKVAHVFLFTVYCFIAGFLRLRRPLSSQRLHYNLTIMVLSDSGLVSDPHATVDITVHDDSVNDRSGGQRRPRFTRRLYQLNISEDALSGASVGTVSVTQRKCCVLEFEIGRLFFKFKNFQ